MSERDFVIQELRQLATLGTTVGGMIAYIKSIQADVYDCDVMLYFQDAFSLSPGRASAVTACFPECPEGIDAGNSTMFVIPEIVRTNHRWKSSGAPSADREADWIERISPVSEENTDALTWIRRQVSEEGWAGLSEEDRDAIVSIEASCHRLSVDLQIVSCLCENLQARLAAQEPEA